MPPLNRYLGFATWILLLGSQAASAPAQTPALADLWREIQHPDLIRTAIGVTRRETPIEAIIAKQDHDYNTTRTRVLLVGGAAGDLASTTQVTQALRWFYTSEAAKDYRDRFVLSAIPCLNPDGVTLGIGPGNGADGNPTRGYPPQGTAYNSLTDPEAAYAWRWIGLHAPDLIVEVATGNDGDGDRVWLVPASSRQRLRPLTDALQGVLEFADDDSLVAQVGVRAPSDTGAIPALRLISSPERLIENVSTLFRAAIETEFFGPSAARAEIQLRLARTPRVLADQLLEHYGGKLDQVVYIPALAVIARVQRIAGDTAEDASSPPSSGEPGYRAQRIARDTVEDASSTPSSGEPGYRAQRIARDAPEDASSPPSSGEPGYRAQRIARDSPEDQPNRFAAVEQIVEPYYSGRVVPALKSGSDLSGHLVFCELAEIVEPARRARYVELARRAADLIFDEQGRAKPVMPFHSEMSDAVFMGGPILARVGQLTGEAKYFDACVQHLRFMQKLNVRSDGLHRHSPLDETAWGRGNGFPAIGLAMCLSAFPESHPARPELLEAFQSHMKTLAKHQDSTGCWHQVIDHPESYRELTATCMITFAMARGVNAKWLAADEYQPYIQRGWYAIRTRVGQSGGLVDVCTGTGKQQSLREYFDRPAILGRDDRGGAMALLAAHEIEIWQRDHEADASTRRP